MKSGAIKAVIRKTSAPSSRDLLTYPMSINTPRSGALVSQDAQEVEPLRWVRDPDELCVASVHRSSNINRINNYVATYKFNDPQWQPFLFPEVFANTSSDGEDQVIIDYSKLTSMELMARHANYSLRHLVQKGHAMYFVTYSQHSILEMRGLIESSFITCSYGVRGERLRTHLVHVGPLDLRDVMELKKEADGTLSVHFNLNKPTVRRGVVALSLVEGYGTWFQRKPMLWQRTRRIGALQSTMGAYNYDLLPPHSVGRRHPYEVSLLEEHASTMGGTAGGGCEAVGIIASSLVSQNKKMYLGQFEAPAIAALDSVQQLAHHTALHHKLVREVSDPSRMEQFLPVSWVTRTPPPYVPLESDLPFKLQLSRPNVFPVSDVRHPYPTGGTVGSPFIEGAPLTLMEYHLHQGVDHYVFDDAPNARPLKWWNQKSNLPYNGYMYFMRSGLLDAVRPAEKFENPLAKKSASAYKRSSKTTQRLKSARRRGTKKAPPEEEGEVLVEYPDPDSDEIRHHDLTARQEEERAVLPEEEEEHATRQRGNVHNIVPPNATAQGRLHQYTAKQIDPESKSSLRTTPKNILKMRLKRLKKKSKQNITNPNEHNLHK